MKMFVLLTACGLLMTVGCQTSANKTVDTSQRPAATAPPPAPAPSYSMSYEAVRDTDWAAGTEAGAKRGTLRAGDRVMFSRAPDPSMAWQQAQLPDGSVQWVRPADFRAPASR